MRHFLIFCFAFYFTGAVYAQSSIGSTSQTTVVNDTNCAILPFGQLESWIFKNAKPTTLSQSELRLADSIYMACKNEHKEHLSSKSNYKRQYIAVINSKGEKEIWVNCFCSAHRNDWRKYIIMVNDGGNCFFNFKINLSQKTYYDFSVNGNG